MAQLVYDHVIGKLPRQKRQAPGEIDAPLGAARTPPFFRSVYFYGGKPSPEQAGKLLCPRRQFMGGAASQLIDAPGPPGIVFLRLRPAAKPPAGGFQLFRYPFRRLATKPSMRLTACVRSPDLDFRLIRHAGCRRFFRFDRIRV
jgi:hypothetical protein